MLKLIFFFFIPMISNYWMMSNMFALLTLMFMFLFNTNFIMAGYMMQVDNISVGLIILSIWITFFMIVSSNNYSNDKMFLLLVLLLMMFLMSLVSSPSLILFYIFFEASLIPTMMIIIIMGWGYQSERLIASYYLLFYTLFASWPMLYLLYY